LKIPGFITIPALLEGGVALLNSKMFKTLMQKQPISNTIDHYFKNHIQQVRQSRCLIKMEIATIHMGTMTKVESAINRQR
jgi:hypothetical protein